MTLNQVTFPSLDLSLAVPFYQQLGLELIVEAMPHYARFACPDGGSTFSVHKVGALPVGEGTFIYFECADLDERCAALVKAGITFDEPPSDRDWLWREARLRDPDGNRLILFWGGENRLNPPWRVGKREA
ncbi:VOC family protein [Neolewinella persica]|uniref:VOC family protein n=1 Tax=Neolewinella persica TaxID=70998 RepID=UPI00037E0B0A|nr:VOC family protein [Neolewinella persica]